MSDEQEHSSRTVDAEMQRVREFVDRALGDGIDSAALAFSLAYVAMEMGLTAAPSPEAAFSCLLDGLQQASAAASERASDEAAVPAAGSRVARVLH